MTSKYLLQPTFPYDIKGHSLREVCYLKYYSTFCCHLLLFPWVWVQHLSHTVSGVSSIFFTFILKSWTDSLDYISSIEGWFKDNTKNTHVKYFRCVVNSNRLKSNVIVRAAFSVWKFIWAKLACLTLFTPTWKRNSREDAINSLTTLERLSIGKSQNSLD